MQRTAQAEWKGTGKEGSGTLTTPSGVLKAQPYSFKLRFQDEDGRNGTNPEELIAAAHAGCFSMALSNMLAEAGSPPDSVETESVVTLRVVDGAPTITKIALTTVGRVPGLDDADFQKHAKAAKEGCPVSKALAGVDEITLEASLKS